jgi:CDP-diacylglycerol--serine O-phosphatidyltransferase
VADPWAALAAGGLIYLGMLPLGVRSFRRLKREAEGGQDDEGPPDVDGERMAG